MEDRNSMLMNFVLNDARHLKRFIDNPSPFKSYKKNLKPNSKPLFKGQFYCYSKALKQFKSFFFELYPNLLLKYNDKTKSPPTEFLLLQHCMIFQESEVIGEQVAFGIVLETESEITKLVTEKYQTQKLWSKCLRKYCRAQNFLGRYKVDCRLYDHFYRCIDKKKRVYVAVKIVNKKGLRVDQKKFIETEISILRRVTCGLFPMLKKIYEDDNYIYLTFYYFHGDDLLRIILTSNLEEMAIATLTYHIIKGIKQLHSQNCFHGNIKLENIIFSSSKKENEIFLINMKYLDDPTETYRDRLIRKGNNMYCAPEILEGKPIGPQIDMFAIGCSVFYMIFGRFPYKQIENQFDKWTYELDLNILEEMRKLKKKDPSSVQALSVSGIDFLFKLLEIQPDQRMTAKQALTHHWFINFTSKSDNKKLAKFRELNNIASLRTILESSEMSEREVDMRLLSITQSQKMHKFQQISQITEEKDWGDDDDYTINISEEENQISQFMDKLHDFKNHKEIFQIDISNSDIKNNIMEQQNEKTENGNNTVFDFNIMKRTYNFLQEQSKLETEDKEEENDQNQDQNQNEQEEQKCDSYDDQTEDNLIQQVVNDLKPEYSNELMELQRKSAEKPTLQLFQQSSPFQKQKSGGSRNSSRKKSRKISQDQIANMQSVDNQNAEFSLQ